jgi:hypothetical protein
MGRHEIGQALWDRQIDHAMVEIMQRIECPHFSQQADLAFIRAQVVSRC